MGQPHFMINGVPTAMLFFLATIFALAFVGDLRIIRFGAPREAAPLAHVLRSVQRRRIILLDPRARRQNPSRAVPLRSNACAADTAHLFGDVLLAVATPYRTKCYKRLAQCGLHRGEGWTLKSVGSVADLRWPFNKENTK